VAALKHFLVYGGGGWVLEVMWTGLSSLLHGDPALTGYTYLWMFPIYGSVVLLEPIHDRIRTWRWFTRGLVWMMIFWGIEYLSGGLIQLLTGSVPWDYGTRFPAIDRLIRLDFAPVWFGAGFLFEYVHDKLVLIG
jgi:uncharacterized membrane protein